MASKYHTIGTPKQQSYIEQLALGQGYRDEVAAACEFTGMSSSKLSKKGLSSAQASQLIDWLQDTEDPVDLREVPTEDLVSELAARGVSTIEEA